MTDEFEADCTATWPNVTDAEHHAEHECLYFVRNHPEVHECYICSDSIDAEVAR